MMENDNINIIKEGGEIPTENSTLIQPATDKDEDKITTLESMVNNLQEVKAEVELFKLGFIARSDNEVKPIERVKLTSLFNCINEAITHLKYFINKSKNISYDNKEESELSSCKNVAPEQMLKVEIKEEFEEEDFDDNIGDVGYNDNPSQVEYPAMFENKYSTGIPTDGEYVKKEDVSDTVRAIKDEYVSEDPLDFEMAPVTLKSTKPRSSNAQRKLPPEVDLNQCITPDGQYKCPKCEDKIFKEYAAFKGHVNGHYKVKKELVDCQVCGKKLNHKSLRAHMLNHAEATFQCISCPKKFASLARMNRHQRNVHERVRPITCEVCCKGFRDKQSLEVHSVVHTGEKPHVCEQCGNSYTQKSHLYYHIKKIHEGVKMKKYAFKLKKVMCGQCGKMLPSRSKLEMHIKVVHEGLKIDQDQEKKRFNCPSCSTTFTLRSNLKRHIKVVHEGHKPFSCEYCEKKFSSKNEVKEHTTMHTGEKAYKCEECGKCFSQKSTWYGHKRKNHKEKDLTLSTSLSGI